jgi:hypothetical protein
MPVYVTLSEGDDAIAAEPFLAVSDPRVVQEVIGVVRRRLGSQLPARDTRRLCPVPGRTTGHEEDPGGGER